MKQYILIFTLIISNVSVHPNWYTSLNDNHFSIRQGEQYDAYTLRYHSIKSSALSLPQVETVGPMFHSETFTKDLLPIILQHKGTNRLYLLDPKKETANKSVTIDDYASAIFKSHRTYPHMIRILEANNQQYIVSGSIFPNILFTPITQSEGTVDSFMRQHLQRASNIIEHKNCYLMDVQGNTILFGKVTWKKGWFVKKTYEVTIYTKTISTTDDIKNLLEHTTNITTYNTTLTSKDELLNHLCGFLYQDGTVGGFLHDLENKNNSNTWQFNFYQNNELKETHDYTTPKGKFTLDYFTTARLDNEIKILFILKNNILQQQDAFLVDCKKQACTFQTLNTSSEQAKGIINNMLTSTNTDGNFYTYDTTNNTVGVINFNGSKQGNTATLSVDKQT